MYAIQFPKPRPRKTQQRTRFTEPYLPQVCKALIRERQNLCPLRRHPISRGIYMKRFSLIAAILIMMTAISTLAAPKPTTATVPAFPGTLANARYVYVASYDGDQFDPNLLPEDREAIGSVQNAIQTWGKR